jgi:hypothetical protein
MKSWLFLPSADNPALQWLGFVAFLLVLFVCLGGVVVWLQVARAGKSKRRRRKHRHHRTTNPTLAQTGGLPPKRDPNQPPPGP